MLNYFNTLFNLMGSEAGQDLAEYAILFGLIALMVIAAVSVLGVNINSVFSTLAVDFASGF